MKIVVDARPLLEPRPGGVRFATRGIARSLQDAGADVALWINSASGARDADPSGLDGTRVIAGKIPNKVLNASLMFRRRPHLDRLAGNPDWYLMSNPNFAAFSSRVKVALVIHDLSFEINRSWYSPRQRLWHRMVNPRALVRRADLVVAVSENTKRDLIDFYGIIEGKIVVIPPVITLRPPPRRGRQAQGDNTVMPNRACPELVEGSKHDQQPFILFLGEVTKRKNVLGLIRAFESLASAFPEHQLIIAGPEGWGASEVDRAIAVSPVQNRIRRTGAVVEDQKLKLLARAEVFVYPSFYEGFGLPVVEAMAFGTPVVASHAGSLPEVVGDAGLLIDPYDISTIREAVSVLLSDRALADSYARRGLIRAGEWAARGETGLLFAALRV